MGRAQGDRIKESIKLAKVSLEAYWAYSLIVDILPDDFGRCRLNPKLVAGHLAPRRGDVTAAVVRRILAEYEREGLLRTWVQDGETFGEFTGFKARGNRYHRTPEPPWSEHAHQPGCLATAIHRCREWGRLDEAENLSLQLKKIRDRNVGGNYTGTPTLPLPPSLPSPPSPPNGKEEKGAGPNPLVDRRALVSEGHRLIASIAEREGLDPVEVLSKGSAWYGHRLVRLDVATDDRLAHTVITLRDWDRRLSGLAEPGPPPAPAARARAPTAAERTVEAVRAVVAREGGDGSKLIGGGS